MKEEGIKYKEGDLIQDSIYFDVIAHGCNCFNTFGSGIAYQIKKFFPQVYNEDLKTTKGDKNKLGSYTFCKINPLLTVVNLYTQYGYGRNQQHVDYNALQQCMKLLKQDFGGNKIALPQIGCGLGGGDWNKVEPIIQKELFDEDVTIITKQQEER